MINTVAGFPKTITAACGGNWWKCACGNEPWFEGFWPCSPAGRIIDPETESDWSDWDQKLNFCCQCGLVMDQTTYDPTTQTVAVIGRIQNYAEN
ncbi:MAG: hypothetical protein M3Y48_13325 [Actinomycetota bacterium]|nr:hypothetical protein [Actinomycetota bacterium]